MDDDDFIVGARKNIDCKKNKLENFIIRPEKYEFDMCVKSFLNHFIRENTCCSATKSNSSSGFTFTINGVWRDFIIKKYLLLSRKMDWER